MKIFSDFSFIYLSISKIITTFATANKKSLFCNRGVAQLVAFLVWDQAVAGSSPVTSTRNGVTAFLAVTFVFGEADTITGKSHGAKSFQNLRLRPYSRDKTV